MNFKRILSILLVLVLSLGLVMSLAACGPTTPEDPGTDPVEDEGYVVYVKDESGNAIANVGVQLCSDAGCQLPQKTDSEGKVVFEDLEEDNYKAQISSVPAGYYNPGESVKYPMVDKTAVITLSQSAGYIVNVKDQFGNLVEGAVVTHTGAADAITTDLTGIAHFNAPKKDGYKVFVVAPDGYRATNRVYTYSSGATTVNVTLTKLATITVTVEDATLNDEIANTVVLLYKGTRQTPTAVAVTDSSGVATFEIEYEEGATYYAEAPYVEGYETERVEVTDGSATISATQLSDGSDATA